MIPLNRPARGRLAAAGLLLAWLPLRGQVPGDEQIARDLATSYQTRAPELKLVSRGPLLQELEPLLMQQARYLVSTLHPWPEDPRAWTLTTGARSGEADIRPNAHTALGLAILCRVTPPGAFPAGMSRDTARRKAVAILRFLIGTHGAAGHVLGDGKPWRYQWQSAYWAYLAGEACWLLWDDLTPTERWLAARMVCDEADRFVSITPPFREYIDTKAEENAWDSMVIGLAVNMFPRNLRAPLWKDLAIRWTITAFAAPRDLASMEPVDGRPLRAWLIGANIHDDYTLENHGRVHPDYMSTTTMLSYQRPLYLWAGKEPPQSLDHNIEAIYANAKRLSFPDGGWIYPNGEDWQLHRGVDWLEYHAFMAVRYGDRQAAALTRVCLETMRRMAARTPGGGIGLPGESRHPAVPAMLLEWPAQAYLLWAQCGEGPEPVAASQLWRELAGRHEFEQGRFGVLRTPKSIAAFSWSGQVMGMILPSRTDRLLTPNPRGLVGYVSVPGVKQEAPQVEKIAVAPFQDALGVTGILSRGNGALEQRFAFLALPDGRTVYADIVRATGTIRPKALNLGTLGVLNDLNWAYHHGSRTLVFDGGTKTFAAADANHEPPAEFSSRWYNLDGLGIVCLDVSGRQLYVPKPTDAVGRLEQVFHLNSIPASALARTPSSGPLAHSAIVFYPEQSVAATKRSAELARFRSDDAGNRIEVTLEDGKRIEFDLARLQMSLSPGGTR